MTTKSLRTVLAAALLCACGEGAPSTGGAPTPTAPVTAGAAARVERVQGDQQIAPAGMRVPVHPAVMVTDHAGRGVANVPVRFYVSSGGGWVADEVEVLTDAGGMASTEWYMGPRVDGNHILGVSTPVGGTGFRAYVTALDRGQTYRSSSGLVELTLGELPLILGAPHGGTLAQGLPDRTAAGAAGSATTQQLARAIAAELTARGGRTPSLVVSLLERRKMDPDIALAEGGHVDRTAALAWREYHGLLGVARAYVEQDFGRGLFLDVQGDAAVAGRVELGYLLTAADLAETNTTLDAMVFSRRSSIRALSLDNQPSFSQIVRGPDSFGDLLLQQGIRAAPSTAETMPAPYNGTGYSASAHGSRDGGLVSAIVVRTPDSLRDSPQSRSAFATGFVHALNGYFLRYYRGALTP